MFVAIGILIGLIVGTVAAVVTVKLLGSTSMGTAQKNRRMVLDQAERDADTTRREAEISAREDAVKLRGEVERELGERRARMAQAEERVHARAEELERRQTDLERREQGVSDREVHARALQEELKTAKERELQELERVSGMTVNDAKGEVLARSEELVRHELARRVRQLEEEAQSEARRRARNLVADALQRVAASHAAETTVSLVELPSDDMKGRIIGREGRNIRAIEAATGVDLIIDDTPEAVVISCHNPIRRELARLALDRLISDGRIHPGRIEEVVRKAEQELEESIREAGQKAVIELGLHGVHQELIRLVGMLKYRYSYAQNVLGHSIETAFIAGALAAELGLNVKQARRAGLLHDIGKALTHEVEGSHAIVGGEIARKYGESAKIVNAIAAHHEEVKAETILAPLVDAADALSGARPGARREVLESYAKRLEDLERISNSFRGVERSYAVQAGREIRIIVDPGTVPDDQALLLARDVARRIEQEMTYPGQIKVTVIRETRASEIAH